MKRIAMTSEERKVKYGSQNIGRIAWNKGKRKIPFITKLCERCFVPYSRQNNESDRDWLGRRFCSKSCSSKGNKRAVRTMSSQERTLRSQNAKSGKESPNWIVDRNQVKINKARHWDSRYSFWRRMVFERDSHKCRMDTGGCGTYIEAHHILSWKDYPELRYQLNNGITLCRAHHPRKRAEEKRLVPVFQGLVSVSNAPIFLG